MTVTVWTDVTSVTCVLSFSVSPEGARVTCVGARSGQQLGETRCSGKVQLLLALINALKTASSILEQLQLTRMYMSVVNDTMYMSVVNDTLYVVLNIY